MCHIVCAGGLALLFSRGNCEQDTRLRDELIIGHGAEGLAAPPYGWQFGRQGSSHCPQWILVVNPGRAIFLIFL